MADDQYTAQEALQMSGWRKIGRRYYHSASLDHFQGEERSRYRDKASRLESELATALEAMIDVLGVRDAYSDETTPDYVTSMLTPWSTPYITHYGRDQFLADLKQLRGAQNSDAAISRLRSAIRDLKTK